MDLKTKAAIYQNRGRRARLFIECAEIELALIGVNNDRAMELMEKYRKRLDELYLDERPYLDIQE